MNNERTEKVIKAVQIKQEIVAKGYSANIKAVKKGGADLIGIEVQGNECDDVVSNVYYPERYEGDAKEIAENIIAHYRESKLEKEIILRNLFKPFEEVKSNLILCLEPVHDADYITREYLDLQMYVRYKITHNASVKVDKGLVNRWKISKDELFDIARENTRKNLTIKGIERVLGINDSNSGLIVCGTETEKYGAAFLAFPEKIKELADIVCDDLYLIPSSIHELLAIKQSDFIGVKEMKIMVTEVNETEVLAEDILSYSIYKYKCSTGEIEIL